MDYRARQRRLRMDLEPTRLDALLVTHLPNIRYLCGFTGSAGVLIVNSGQSTFFTDGRYIEQAKSEVRNAKTVIVRSSPLIAAGQWMGANRRKLSIRVLGIEGEHLSVTGQKTLARNLGQGIRIREAPALVERARMVKDEFELERLRTAVRLGASLFEVALRAIRPGAPEVEVAAEMELAARRKGAEGMSFETIIASGKRSALPHGRASQTPVPARGFVVCDFGVILSGYCSDMTRTVHVGKPSPTERELYSAVREAQQQAVAAVRSGVTAAEVDAAARKVLKKQRLGRYFTHSTGHGVGLEIHEAPRIAAGQETLLQAGMVITIEPGAYIPEVGGVRIEDMVAVTETGCEVLTPTSKDLIIM
jgi:Xaa-Pro aminopeptidase